MPPLGYRGVRVNRKIPWIIPTDEKMRPLKGGLKVGCGPNGGQSSRNSRLVINITTNKFTHHVGYCAGEAVSVLVFVFWIRALFWLWISTIIMVNSFRLH